MRSLNDALAPAEEDVGVVEPVSTMEPVLRAVVSISVLVFAAKMLGEFCNVIRIPAVLGELFAGILFGPHLLGTAVVIFCEPLVVLNEIVKAFADVGAIVVLFAAGLGMTFTEFRRTGPRAFIVASFGAFVPFVLGYGLYTLLGYAFQVAMLIGAALTATSIAISARALEQMGKLDTDEARILVNAAVIDDVLGLAALAVVNSIIRAGGTPSAVEVLSLLIGALLIWLILTGFGVFVIPRFISRATAMRIEGGVETAGIASAFILSAISAGLGLSPIVGAFSAGMAVAGSRAIIRVKEFTRNLNMIFSPIFFSVIGAQVNPADFTPETGIGLLVLTSVAIAGKLVGAGLPSYGFFKDGTRSLIVGFGMIPRGEVGLIIAGIGITSGVISGNLYVQLVGMAILTTILAPIVLGRIYGAEEPLAQIEPLQEPERPAVETEDASKEL